MKIGILTYHRAENYGALLQAYALMSYLRSLGYDVSFVDYWPKYHSDYFRLFPWQQFKNRRGIRKLIFLLQLIFWVIPRFVRKRRLKRFMFEQLGLQRDAIYTSANSKTEKYDVVIYGSDQIWRKQDLDGVGYDNWYFGSDNVQAVRKIVYAGSMGSINTTEKDDLYVKAMMQHFDCISVRELDLHSYLESVGVLSSLVVDPVFLLSKEQWKELSGNSVSKTRYILFYNLLDTPESVRFVKKLSIEKQLPIKEISKKMSPFHIGKRYIKTASVKYFLQLIYGAEYVVSNSFHGVAMSLIFHKKIYAVGMGKKASRVCSLIESLGMEDLYSEEGDKIPDVIIDYKVVENRLSRLVNKSKDFIKESISHE